MITEKFNATDALAGLARLDQGLGNPQQLMQDIGELMVERTKQRFKEGTTPDGTAWASNSAVTLKRKAPETRPLFGSTGRLSSEIFYEADATQVSWGSNLIYAAVQHFGASQGAFGSMSNGSQIPWGDIPARPFLGISEEDGLLLTELVEEWLEDLSQGGN
ncbi:phage virion morphogenesis protein [Thalassovita gelatinovora]|uniref:Phage virion morphogenesis protein n=1 Tax=Thalassovita gelatinovora TaxID=53501 RepID=A0A0P1G8B3_THAGE|nr:phage virion morphogenesis protein [Thalassovita gelatinovora]QIZ81568.1 phage virion morphogenesis protein [Thalassovita gelatinovora]CUH67989.1 phage virion morphogenesis protein [Thalassovita gelatinovora]SEQ26921.1 phage virion morphogenesis (putative tail completion) protein [Thalassovita gelatinovora]